ncbi:hypothetical protein MUN89_11990 [Halobacillus salinarum]|uniref:Uncharacterized protein n=1 Tax=Halobacillus salinarum TaxID=2932257 RepID=A0ABY4EEV8_9BACI|nr:hypothetical protein [Halobacillus salinarum]UOQ42691.1 hypothetical protein MUN89_11990 [Halobacillus salinarum]
MQNLNLTMVLPMNSGEYHYIETEAVVIRLINKTNLSKELASIELQSISEQNRQLIIKFCFEQQMNMRKRQLK